MNDVAALHQVLVDKLKAAGHIWSPGVEAAFRAVPRHVFLPGVSVEAVYRDEAIPTKHLDGEVVSSSSQPKIMAVMLEQLGLEPGHRVLEVGAGTGYNAALMAHIVGDAGQVITVDIDEDIVENARAHLAEAGFGRVQVTCGDGGFGYAGGAPYDRIILTVGAWDIAPAWREQLRTGGRLVLPLSLRGAQRSAAFELSDGHLTSVSVKNCIFMPLRGAFANPETHVQLGPGLGLYVWLSDPRSIDAEAAYKLLTGPSRDCPTRVRVTPGEIFGGLILWLALRESSGCALGAQGELATRGTVPYLLGIDKNYFTVGLLEGPTLCVLMCQPDQSPPPEPISDPPPFDLFVRSFGPDETLAQRLVDQIIAWDAAGRPSTKGLRIRAYPMESDYVPLANEFVIPKRWTQLVLDWP